jgi:hypothetical protein
VSRATSRTHASRVDARWRGFLEGKLVETLRPDVVIEVYSELALVSQRPARLAAFVGERELVEYRSATALHTAVPSGRAPALEPGFDDASFEALTEGGWRIGAGPARVLVRLELPEPLAEGDELLVGFDVTAPKPSLVAAYHGVEPWRLPGGFPEVRDLAPIELKAGRQQVVVPLAADPRATAVWLLVPPKAGPFDVHALDVRSATATSPEGAPR